MTSTNTPSVTRTTASPLPGEKPFRPARGRFPPASKPASVRPLPRHRAHPDSTPPVAACPAGTMGWIRGQAGTGRRANDATDIAATASSPATGANVNPARIDSPTSGPVIAAPAALPTVNAVMIQANASTAVPAGVNRSAVRNTAVSTGGSENPAIASSTAIGPGPGTRSSGTNPSARPAVTSRSRPGPPG